MGLNFINKMWKKSRKQPVKNGSRRDLGLWQPSSSSDPKESESPAISPPTNQPKPRGKKTVPKRNNPVKDHGLFYYLLWYLYMGSLLTFAGAVFFGIGLGWPMLNDHINSLPGIELVNDYRPDLGSQLLDYKGKPLADFFKEKRQLVRYQDLPQQLIQALIATEDQQFYKHHGVNPVRIVKALWSNTLSGTQQGGSTLTQQIVKDLYVGWEKSINRKIREALYAMKIERELSKEEILTIYFNQVMFGHNTRGIKAAAEFYFGKTPSELSLAESATLIGLLKGNTAYSPLLNPERSKQRRALVLKEMEECGFITAEEREKAAAEELRLQRKNVSGAPQLDLQPYWRAFLQNQILSSPEQATKNIKTNDRFFIDSDTLYSGGIKIHSTLDPEMQDMAERSLRQALINQEQIRRKNRPGWGLESSQREKFATKISPNAVLLGKITGYVEPAWLTVQLVDIPEKPVVAVPHPGNEDWRSRFEVLSKDYYVPLLALDRVRSGSDGVGDIPEEDLIQRGLVSRQTLRFQLVDSQRDQHAQGAMVCLEVGTGKILAWVGGFDWYEEPAASRRIRCVDGQQPGSSFKPLIFAAAFENGYTPSTKVSNESYSKMLPNGKVWRPGNYDKERVGGFFQIREVLIRSLNIPTVRVFENLIGQLYEYDPVLGQPTLSIARRLGIKSPIPKELSVALGTADVSPLEMATAFSVFANNGILVEPYGIESVETRDGRTAYVHLPSGNPQALDPTVSFLITDILTGVIRDKRGTGYALAHNFPFPIAGKTGTTNQYFDAWFVGYSKHLCTAVWIGHDRRTSLGASRAGGRVALPPWLSFMEKAIPHHLQNHLGYSKKDIASASGNLTTKSLYAFAVPEGGVNPIEVCRYSLMRPNAFCKTTTIWVRKGEEPTGICRDCGVVYKDAPSTQGPRIKSAQELDNTGQTAVPRPIKSIRLETTASELDKSSGPPVDIPQGEAGTPEEEFFTDEGYIPEPAVPRPIPPRPVLKQPR